ncbi:MAG: bifunctional lysylphosphatidylglycerol flippase/synthetase MprF [Microbacterium sp.]
MTDAETTSRPAVVRVAFRIPATLSLIAAILVVGVVSAGLWTPFEDSPLWETVAYGLPALLEGRWWTPFTGTFFVNHPLIYVFTILSFAGMAYLEYRRGSRVALAYFSVGQLFAIFGSALLLWLLAMLPWPWAQAEALVLDVGASGGTMACIAAAAGLLTAPWRTRAWVLILGFSFVTLFFWGSLADLEHALAVGMVLAVDRSLRIRRTTVREQRLIAFVGILTILAIIVLTYLVPTAGPFGDTDAADGSVIDVAIDVVIVLLIANGLRRGRRWAWVVSIVLGLFNLVTGVLFVILLVVAPPDSVVDTVGDLSVAIAQSALWVVFLVYLIWVRGAFRARRKATVGSGDEPSVEDVKEQLRAHGGGTLSWMTTWGGNSYARTSGGIVAYQKRAGVAIALADPLGPAASRGKSVAEFITLAETAGLIPCFFSASDATKDAVPGTSRSLVVADDTIVDLPGLQFTGKAWSAVRTSLNRAGREEMTFRLTRLADETWGIQQQLRAISEMWVGDKGLPEMGFTLGTLDEAMDPEVRVALAISPKGDVDGFLSWLPIYGDDGVRGWTLDLMRRREGGFGPVMEFLIGSSAKQFSEEGAQIMSLSGAPLAHDYPPDAGAIASLSDWLANMLEPVYGFGSLHRFKEKFHPRYETMYLLFRDESDLTRIGAGLTRAFLPDATLRQFAGAGVELVRGERD